jgi:hypothetical protein
VGLDSSTIAYKEKITVVLCGFEEKIERERERENE